MGGILVIFSVSVVLTTSSLAAPRTDIESNSVRDPLIDLSASDAVDNNLISSSATPFAYVVDQMANPRLSGWTGAISCTDPSTARQRLSGD